jgi:esterase/lipase superfamily enzyme/ribosomal protein S18 acetylase RimI-like enzyme
VAEVERYLNHESSLGFSLEIFPSWADPPGGVIPMPGPQDTPFEHTHYVTVFGCDRQSRRFKFLVRWPGWGDDRKGYLPYEYFDRYVFECRGIYVNARPESRRENRVDGTKEIRWVVRDEWDRRVYGYEINSIHAADRWAWAFVVERDEALEVEEIYVRPEFRRRGFAERLCRRIQELASAKLKPLRLWVPFADCRQESPGTFPAIIALARRLGLHFQPCPVRWFAYYATDELAGSDSPIEASRIPSRPRAPSNELTAAAHALSTWQYTVWYATDRNVVGSGESEGFGVERDNDVHYGKCLITIPKSHRFGKIKSGWWDRCVHRIDDCLKLDRVVPFSEDDFWSEIRSEIDKCPSGERQSLVFLHGYNVSFEGAAIRAAQIGFDLKVSGITAFFSWPSKASTFQYLADEATIETSARAIADFLVRFATDSGSERVHLIAHSMGNRGLLRGLQQIVSQAEQASRVRFGQIFVMAPDIDTELFCQLAEAYRKTSLRTTLYASSDDRAVRTSGFLHNYPRAGFIPPVTIVPGVDTIEVPGFNLLDLGHSYYAEAAAVLHDVFDLIRNDSPPCSRQRLVEMKSPTDEIYWRIMD